MAARSLRLGQMAVVNRTVSWLRANPLVADGLLAAVFVAAAIVIGIVAPVPEGEREIGVLGWVLLIGNTAPIAVRRVWPLISAWTVLGTNLPYWILDFPDDPIGPTLLIAVYSVGAHVARPVSLRNGVAMISLIVAVGTLGVIVPEEDLPWYAIPAFVVMYGTAWILGDNLRTRRAYLAELERTAAQAEAQRAAEARNAVAEERTRIARDLHDVVAHSMSVMVVQAGAARRVIDSSPDQAAAALEAIESTGRESLDEMRRILGVLRSDDEELELAPAPTIDDFSRLIDHCEQAGLNVALEVDGEPTGLPASIEMSAYRIVQESLTNTLKHAGAASATVRLAYAGDELTVAVTDNGRGAAANRSGGGQGLVGMRERVEAFGGTLAAGPRAGGGFAVTAVLPVRETR